MYHGIDITVISLRPVSYEPEENLAVQLNDEIR